MARVKKIVYYDDLLNDEFSGTHIKRKPLGKRFKYIHRNPLWKFLSYLIYYTLALPILWCVSKIGWGVKVVGRKQLKKLPLKGYFIFCNHTQIGDGFFPQCFISKLRRNYVISNEALYTMDVETPWLHFGKPNNVKTMDYINVVTDGTAKFTVQATCDMVDEWQLSIDMVGGSLEG